MVHVSLLCCHNREGGKLISPGLSRKILRFVLGWGESSSMRQSRLRSLLSDKLSSLTLFQDGVWLCFVFAFFHWWRPSKSCVPSHVPLNSIGGNTKFMFYQVGKMSLCSRLVVSPFCFRSGLPDGHSLLGCHRHICHRALDSSKGQGRRLQGHLCSSWRRSVPRPPTFPSYHRSLMREFSKKKENWG